MISERFNPKVPFHASAKMNRSCTDTQRACEPCCAVIMQRRSTPFPLKFDGLRDQRR